MNHVTLGKFAQLELLKTTLHLKSQGMPIVALLSCSKSKKPVRTSVCDLYSPSYLFRASCQIAQQLTDTIFVLSAKHGVLTLDTIIDPYDESLVTLSRKKRKEWADRVIHQLSRQVNLNQTYFLIFAGKAYYEFLLPHFSFYALFFDERDGIGKRVSYLSKLLSSSQSSIQTTAP